MADGLERRGDKTESRDVGGLGGAGRRRHYHHEARGQVQRGCSPENSDFFFMILAIHPGLEGELNLKITS